MIDYFFQEKSMANTTFNGPVRSENGFEIISVNSTTGAVTDITDVDSSGNIVTNGSIHTKIGAWLQY